MAATVGDEYLAEEGLYIDEITKKVELLDPERCRMTRALIKHVNNFEIEGGAAVASLEDVMASLERMVNLVDSGRREMLGTQSALLLESNLRETQVREIRTWIREKVLEVERRRLYLESLHRQKSEKLETINMLKQ